MISSKAAVVDRSGEAINLHFKFVYTRSLAPFGRNTSCLRRPSPLACAVDHAAAFAVNAALVVSQWQKLSRVKLSLASIPKRRARGWTGRKY